MKTVVTVKKDIGKNGPGIYVLDEGKKDIHGKPLRKVITITDKDKIVEQSQKQLTDVDVLLEPAKRNGLLRHVTRYEGEYDDIPAASYEEALKITTQANTMFENLPLNAKRKFNNNPKEFLEFVQNPANGKEMIKLGLAQGNDGLTAKGTPSGAPTDLNRDGRVDTVDSNADGVPDTNPK